MILCYNSKCVEVFWKVSLLHDSWNEFSVTVYIFYVIYYKLRYLILSHLNFWIKTIKRFILLYTGYTGIYNI